MIKVDKKWEELQLCDNFIFQKFMSNEENCKKVLSELLGEEVERIEYLETEKTFKAAKESKGIRVDVYIKGDDKVYNIEMQSSVHESLDKRSRYYHSILDESSLNVGEFYTDLKDTYVIFICTFDLFGKGEYVYKIKNTCTNVNGIDYDDGAYTYFLNTKGTKGNVSEDLKTFLKAAEGHFDSNDYSAKIKSEVESIKNYDEWRREYMFQEMRDIENKRMGKKEGIEEGKEIAIIELVKDGVLTAEVAAERLGITVDEVMKKINE